MRKSRFQRLLLVPILLAALSRPARGAENFPVRESWGKLSVKTHAPIPSEVSNDTQAHALAREAATVLGQNALLTYIEAKKTRSKKTLAEAEIPSNELQEKVHRFIKGARVVKTEWTKDQCFVTLSLDKSQLNALLKRN